MSNATKSFDILTTSLGVLYNYFDDLTKLLSTLYLAKFLNALAELFFPCIVSTANSSMNVFTRVKSVKVVA